MSGVYARYNGEWYVVGGSGGSLGAAVVSGQNGGTVQSGVTIDGKTYDIYTFTEATTRASVTLTDEARKRITDEDIVAAVESADSVEDLISEYGDVLRDALVVVPASDPGLSITVSTPGMVEIMVVAGGGGGGGGQNAPKGGGGAGGLINTPLLVEEHTYEIKVGDGAAGGGASTAPSGGLIGGDSIGLGLTARGGGGGGYSPSYNTGVTTAGLAGGSGGGGSPPGSTLPYLSCQGNPGGGMGGGGAGGPGISDGNLGGPGFMSNITGTELEYAIGGGFGDAPTAPGSGGKSGVGYGAGYAGQAGIVIARVEV